MRRKKLKRHEIISLISLAVAIFAAAAGTLHTAKGEAAAAADTSVEPSGGSEGERTYSLPADLLRHPLMAAPIEGEIRLQREGYRASYNADNRQPNYVTWTLTPQRLQGDAKRRSSFYEDPELADDAKSLLSDYSRSGYDRGHLCPAGDNKWRMTAMIESFLLSNICPQKHTLNSGDWRVLEEACRTWAAEQGDTLHLVAGPLFNPEKSQWLKKRVRIPSAFFKTIVNLRHGKEKGIAFIFRNTTDDQPLQQAACTIDEVERLTGYDFYAELPGALQARIESENHLPDWTK